MKTDSISLGGDKRADLHPHKAQESSMIILKCPLSSKAGPILGIFGSSASFSVSDAGNLLRRTGLKNQPSHSPA